MVVTATAEGSKTDHLLQFHKIPVEKYLLWKARTSVYFYGAAFDLPSNTYLLVTFRTSFGVTGANIILLYSISLQ